MQPYFFYHHDQETNGSLLWPKLRRSAWSKPDYAAGMARDGDGLAFRCLETHHRRDTWASLGLPPHIDHAWFRRVQEEAGDCSPHTLSKLLAHVFTVARCLPAAGADIERAVRAAAAANTGVRPENRGAYRRRLYRAANLAWHQAHGELEGPLTVPATRRVMHPLPADTRVFSAADVEALRHAAAAFNTNDRLLIEVLFTTGLRIAAVAGLRWRQVLDTNGGGIACVCYAREKGCTIRAVPLTRRARELLTELRRGGAGEDPDAPVFPVTVQTLRAHFKAVCRAAGHTGEHCHPHRARHSVAHMLFSPRWPRRGEGVGVPGPPRDPRGQQCEPHFQVPRPPLPRNHQRLLPADELGGGDGAPEGSVGCRLGLVPRFFYLVGGWRTKGAAPGWEVNDATVHTDWVSPALGPTAG